MHDPLRTPDEILWDALLVRSQVPEPENDNEPLERGKVIEVETSGNSIAPEPS